MNWLFWTVALIETILHVHNRMPYVKNKLLYFYWSEIDAIVSVTRYRLDGPGIKTRWRWDFLHPSLQALAPPIFLSKGAVSLSWG